MADIPSYVKIAAALLLSVTVSCIGVGQTEVAEEPAPLPPEPKHATLLFAGDVMCHLPQVSAARQGDGSYDFSSSFEYVSPLFRQADVAVVNFETVVSPDGRYSGYPAFSSPAALASALKDAGADIVLTANNHCCDRGARGIRATADCFDSLGIARTGAFRDSTDFRRNHPLRFMQDSISFALFDYTYGTNGIPVPAGCIVNLTDSLSIFRDLESAADADCRIVFMHWGEEYVSQPTKQQRRLAEAMKRHGADIIIGSHPHVIQPADTLGGKIVVYSLGNFVSNQRKRYCDGGLIAQVEAVKECDGAMRYTLSLQPVWVRRAGYRILPQAVADTLAMTPDEQAQYRLFISDTERMLAPAL